tara:strand:- start:284 stop:1054 length:771 start_codon:yes stop_codon:yes gene_type:complete
LIKAKVQEEGLCDLKDIFKQVIKRYPALAWRMAPLLLLLAVVKDLNLLFFGADSTPSLLSIPQFFLVVICLCCCYVLANSVINKSDKSLGFLLNRSKKKIMVILFLIMGMVLFFYAFFHVFTIALAYFPHKKKAIELTMVALTLIIAIPLGYLAAKFKFFVPLMLCENYSLLDAVMYSSQLVSGHLARALKLVCFAVVFYLLSSQSTRHSQELSLISLNIPFDFLLSLIFLPFFFGMTLLLMKDLILRDKMAVKRT